MVNWSGICENILYVNFPLALVFSYIILRKKSIQVSELIGSVFFHAKKHI